MKSHSKFVWIGLALVLGHLNPASAIPVQFQEGDGGLYSRTFATWLEERSPAPARGNDAFIQIETEYRPTGTSDLLFRTLISFPDIFGNQPGQIPLGSTINSASLSLNIEDNGGATDRLQMFRMLTAWDESTATWNSFGESGVSVRGNSGGGQPGVDYDTTVLLDTTVNNAVPFFRTFTGAGGTGILDAVQLWSNGAVNAGFMLLNTGSNNMRFTSDNGATQSLRPLLTVDFTPPIVNASAVPEPATTGLLLMGLAGLMRRRKHG